MEFGLGLAIGAVLVVGLIALFTRKHPFTFDEYHRELKGVADFIDVREHLEPTILRTKTGGYYSVFDLTGRDKTLTVGVYLDALVARWNEVTKGLGDGWAIGLDLGRESSQGFPRGESWPHPTLELLDREAQVQYEAEGAHYESEGFVTFTYQPASTRRSWLKEWFVGSQVFAEEAFPGIEVFRSAVRHVTKSVSVPVPQSELAAEAAARRGITLEPLGLRESDGAGVNGRLRVESDLLRYCRRVVMFDDRPVGFVGNHLDEYDLCHVDELIAGAEAISGRYPRIGKFYYRCISLTKVTAGATIAGALDSLGLQATEYRWFTRGVFRSKAKSRGKLDQTRRWWGLMTVSFLNRARQEAGGEASHQNMDAASLRANAVDALSVIESGTETLVDYSSTIVVWDTDQARLQAKAEAFLEVLTDLNVAAVIEDIDSFEALLSTWPANLTAGVRGREVRALQFFNSVPFTRVWPGPRKHPSSLMPPGSTPTMMVHAEGSTARRFDTYTGTLGHFRLLGTPGFGKSTLIAFILWNSFRLKNAQGFLIETGMSGLPLCMMAGGHYYRLSVDGPLKLAPFAHLDTEADLSNAVDTVVTWVALHSPVGARVSPKRVAMIRTALEQLARDREPGQRTVSNLAINIQDEEIEQILAYYKLGGPGQIMSGGVDNLAEGNLVGFDLADFSSMSPQVSVPILLHILKTINRRIRKNRPTTIIVDEAWQAFRHPMFAEAFDRMLREFRKYNARVGFSSQFAKEITEGPLSSVLLGAVATNIYSGNPNALKDEELAKLCSEEELHEIASLGMGEYFSTSQLGQGRFTIELGPIAQRLLTGYSTESLAELLTIFEHTGDAISSTNEWLRRGGLMEEAEIYMELAQRFRSGEIDGLQEHLLVSGASR
jgi:type IV secretory pathway VirB4 component